MDETGRSWEPFPWRWLGLACLVSLYLGGCAVHYAFSGDYIVHADTRLHVTWLQQLMDPHLFAQDLSASYYQTFSPRGFKALYGLAAQWGIEPLVLAKLLPIPLGLIASAYFFGICWHLFPVPVGAFTATLIFTQNLWLQNDVITGTPRAFGDPLLAAFLYYRLNRQLLPCLGVLLLQGLFYPVLVPVEAGILMAGLLRWQGIRPRLSRERGDYGYALGGLLVALGVLVPTLLSGSDYGPAFTATQMQGMAEFYPGGRTPYFGVHPLLFWTTGRSGLNLPLMPPVICLGVLLPFLSVARSRFSLVAKLTPQRRIFAQILLPSLALYGLAHVLLLKLYYPSRYTYFGLRFTLALAAGITATILLDTGLHWLRSHGQQARSWSPRERVGVFLVGVFAIASVLVPALPPVLVGAHYWRVGTEPELYAFLAQQPQDVMVASLSKEAENLPSFAQRSVLVSRATINAFHLDYYNQIQQRLRDVITAQYSPQLSTVQEVIETYKIDYWLLDRGAFDSDYLERNRWLQSYQALMAPAMTRLAQGQTPVLKTLVEPCSVLSSDRVILVETQCVLAPPRVRLP